MRKPDAQFDVRLVTYDRAYLERSWAWLNDPEIKHLTRTPDFTREDQERFFSSISTRSDYFIWGVETIGGHAIGAAGLKNVRAGSAEVWCYIGERQFWGQGYGPQVIYLCEAEARKREITSLSMIANSDNRRSLSAFQRQGFVVVPEASSDTETVMSKELK